MNTDREDQFTQEVQERLQEGLESLAKQGYTPVGIETPKFKSNGDSNYGTIELRLNANQAKEFRRNHVRPFNKNDQVPGEIELVTQDRELGDGTFKLLFKPYIAGNRQELLKGTSQLLDFYFC